MYSSKLLPLCKKEHINVFTIQWISHKMYLNWFHKSCIFFLNPLYSLTAILLFPQTYVQDLLVEVGAEVYRQVALEKGHFYVCGDCTMAECVYQKLKTIVQEHGRLSDQEVENFMLQMRVGDTSSLDQIKGILTDSTTVRDCWHKWLKWENAAAWHYG